MTPEPVQQGLVTVGIVAWNSVRDLPECLACLAAQEYPQIELVAVDNASTDESVPAIRKAFPRAQIIQNRENRGYCAAHNQAIRAARGEYYLPLNPDVRLQPGYAGRLVEALEREPRAGSAVGKILQSLDQSPPRIDSTGLFIDRRRHQYLRGYGQPDRGQYDRAEEVFGADGAAPLLRREMLEDTAVFGEYYDEQHFIYMEDVDLAWRARLLGWACRYEPGALARHERAFKPGNRRVMTKALRRIAVKNRYLTIYKNESAECWRRDWWRILFYDLLIWGYILLREQSSLKAIPMLRRQWERAREWRQEIRRRTTVPVEAQRSWFH
jgi:GT2 family glycosyltransferase